MTRILLIRHATTGVMKGKLCGRAPGIPLCTSGRTEALALAHALSSRKLCAIYSSPLQRACETADEIAKRQHLPVSVDDRFTELDFGLWTGKSFDELAGDSAWHIYNRSRSLVLPPGGESPAGALDRAKRGLDDIVATHDGGEAAIITHADVIRSLLTSLLGMELDHLLRFDILPASVTEAWLGNDYPVLHSMNTTYAVGK